MHQHNGYESVLGTVVRRLLGCVIAACVWTMTTGMLALFFLLKRPLSRALHLEWHSARWSSLQWCYLPLKWLAGLLCLIALANASHQLSAPPARTDQIIAGLLALCVGLACGLLFNVLHWMERYARDPAIQKKMAGIAAERYVQRLIEEYRQDCPGSRALHGKLFVFHANTPEEFSVEADHLLITERNIFVIETKCKSGTVSAQVDASTWKVSSPHGDGDMRNALQQAKNAARVLQRQAALPCELIPLVAIKGNDVTIVDGPTNVLVAAHLINVLRAFEHGKPDPILDPASVTALLLPHMHDDPAAMARHIQRAKAAKARAQMTAIVNAASIR
jgi:hypothetical protein